MVSSTFGKHALFKPTPSSCHPPPPPPPLPYDVPCQRGNPGFQMQLRSRIILRRSVGGIQTDKNYFLTGYPKFGAIAGKACWTLTLQTADFVYITWKLLCPGNFVPGEGWQSSLDGICITPTNDFLPFTTGGFLPGPGDSSIPNGPNNLVSFRNAPSPVINGWHNDTPATQWFTVGAPVPDWWTP